MKKTIFLRISIKLRTIFSQLGRTPNYLKNSLLILSLGVAAISVSAQNCQICAGLAADIHPTDSSFPGADSNFLIEVDGKLYFDADDGIHGIELWVYDPATGTASLAADINPAGSSAPSSQSEFFIEVNGKLYFDADDGTHGRELWVYDPATGTAFLAADINPADSSEPGARSNFLIEVNGKLYFDADDGTHGIELWVYDPTTGMAALAADIAPVHGSSPGDNSNFFIEVGGKLYFDADDGTHGIELWVYDPATGMAALAADINPTGHSGPGRNSNFFIEVGSKIYFDADDGIHGRELWVYDPVTGIASLAADIHPTGSSLPGAEFLFFLEVGGKIYFDADDGIHGTELWVYDPTTGIASLAADINPTSHSLTGEESYFYLEVGGKIYLNADDGTHETELWVYDPATGMASLAADIHPTDGSEPSELSTFFIEVGGKIYFDAEDNIHRRELWVYDPSTGMASLAADINPLSGQSFPGGWSEFLIEIGGKLYFDADDGTNGRELWTAVDLATIAPNKVIISSESCNGTGGVLVAPANNCPKGSTLNYSTDGTTFSATLPTYNQTLAQTIYTRCDCTSGTAVSNTNTIITNPDVIVITGRDTTICAGQPIDLSTLVTGTPLNSLACGTTFGTYNLAKNQAPTMTTTFFVRDSNTTTMCVDTAKIVVTVENQPLITARDTMVMLGEPVDLSTLLNQSVTGSLDFGLSLGNYGLANPVSAMDTTYIIRDSVQNAVGCVDTAKVKIIIPTVVTSLVDKDGDGNPDITDPCNCFDPENVRTNNSVALFHDFVTITNGGSNQTWVLDAVNSGDVLNKDGSPISLNTPLTDLGGGVYRLDLWHRPDIGFNATFRRISDNNLQTVGGSCSAQACIIIPTMSQWGLLIFGLLVLNLGLVFVRQVGRIRL